MKLLGRLDPSGLKFQTAVSGIKQTTIERYLHSRYFRMSELLETIYLNDIYTKQRNTLKNCVDVETTFIPYLLTWHNFHSTYSNIIKSRLLQTPVQLSVAAVSSTNRISTGRLKKGFISLISKYITEANQWKQYLSLFKQYEKIGKFTMKKDTFTAFNVLKNMAVPLSLKEITYDTAFNNINSFKHARYGIKYEPSPELAYYLNDVIITQYH